MEHTTITLNYQGSNNTLIIIIIHPVVFRYF